jgi:PadR family transcriptional regulator PadR
LSSNTTRRNTPGLTPPIHLGLRSCLSLIGRLKLHARKGLQGTLDLLVLKTLDQKGEMHGYVIVLHVQRASDELLAVEEGSLYPARHRMEQSGWIKSNWALTESGRKAKYYRLTAAGRKELESAEKSFDQLVKGVRAVMRTHSCRF